MGLGLTGAKLLTFSVLGRLGDEANFDIFCTSFRVIQLSVIIFNTGWDKTVHDHLKALASNPVETLWPRDTLFKYVCIKVIVK